MGGTTSTTCPGSPTAGGTAFRARTVCVRIALRVRNSTWCRSSIGQSAGPSSRRQRVRFPSAPHAHVGELADLVRLRPAKPSTGDTPGEFESRTLRHPVEAEEVSGASLITRRQKVQLLPTGLMPTWSNGQDTGLRKSLGSHAVPAAHPRSSVDRAPGSERDGREFESRRGTQHGRMSEWSGAGPQNRSRRFESGCGLNMPSTVDVRRRALAARPPLIRAERPVRHRGLRRAVRAALRSRVCTATDQATLRCEALRLLLWVMYRRPGRRYELGGFQLNSDYFPVRRRTATWGNSAAR